MEDEVEDIVGCVACLSSNDLCDLDEDNYRTLCESCFGIKIADHLKYICATCIEKLEVSAALKQQTLETQDLVKRIFKEEEYMDEEFLEEESRDDESNSVSENDCEDIDDEHAIQTLDETRCIYCGLQLSSAEEAHTHIRAAHAVEPRTGLPLKKCRLCGDTMTDPAEHVNQCQNIKIEKENRQYGCHFCDNVYTSRKACFTHLRMKHGIKFIIDQTTMKNVERKKCPMCTRDFSQKQVLNKHLWKTHGMEVEKRKAFICPLCDERVSYGSNFSAHLLHSHKICEQVEKLEFYTMDDFLLFKNAIQEETKFRFRKTTASKQTIEGIRSHYMCSQSGVYIYQGKGKRPAPDRQIYKTGKACPAHMIVTETIDRVLVTFYKTHVGHGPCPYYEPREPKKVKTENPTSDCDTSGEKAEENAVWICETCGLQYASSAKFNQHVASHGLSSIPCQYCGKECRDMKEWTEHVQTHHNATNCYEFNNFVLM